MRLNRHRNLVLAVAAFAGLSVVGRTADAQMPPLHPSFYGSAEADTRNTQFYLLGREELIALGRELEELRRRVEGSWI